MRARAALEPAAATVTASSLRAATLSLPLLHSAPPRVIQVRLTETAAAAAAFAASATLNGGHAAESQTNGMIGSSPSPTHQHQHDGAVVDAGGNGRLHASPESDPSAHAHGHMHNNDDGRHQRHDLHHDSQQHAAGVPLAKLSSPGAYAIGLGAGASARRPSLGAQQRRASLQARQLGSLLKESPSSEVINHFQRQQQQQ